MSEHLQWLRKWSAKKISHLIVKLFLYLLIWFLFLLIFLWFSIFLIRTINHLFFCFPFCPIFPWSTFQTLSTVPGNCKPVTCFTKLGRVASMSFSFLHKAHLCRFKISIADQTVRDRRIYKNNCITGRVVTRKAPWELQETYHNKLNDVPLFISWVFLLQKVALRLLMLQMLRYTILTWRRFTRTGLTYKCGSHVFRRAKSPEIARSHVFKQTAGSIAFTRSRPVTTPTIHVFS